MRCNGVQWVCMRAMRVMPCSIFKAFQTILRAHHCFHQSQSFLLTVFFFFVDIFACVECVVPCIYFQIHHHFAFDAWSHWCARFPIFSVLWPAPHWTVFFCVEFFISTVPSFLLACRICVCVSVYHNLVNCLFQKLPLKHYTLIYWTERNGKKTIYVKIYINSKCYFFSACCTSLMCSRFLPRLQTSSY